MTQLVEMPDLQDLAQSACKKQFEECIKAAFLTLDEALVHAKTAEEKKAAIARFQKSVALTKDAFEAAWSVCGATSAQIPPSPTGYMV